MGNGVHYYNTTPPTRLEVATRCKATAEADLARAKDAVIRAERNYTDACVSISAAIADERGAKACTCCPTCGGKKT